MTQISQHVSNHRAGSVIQIAGDANSVTITGARELNLDAYLGWYAAAPAEPSKARQVGYTATGRRQARVLSPFTRNLLPLLGRDREFQRLKDWLTHGGPLGLHIVTGSAGQGKTRLAVALADWAREQGWKAGFLRSEQDGDLVGARWTDKTLVIIDYAAARTQQIRGWLRHLAAMSTDHPPLRILLLERQGDRAALWWQSLFGGSDAKSDYLQHGLLAADAPLALTALANPDLRFQLFTAVYQAASAAAVPERSPALDLMLDRLGLVNSFPETGSSQGSGSAYSTIEGEHSGAGRGWRQHPNPMAGQWMPIHLATLMNFPG